MERFRLLVLFFLLFYGLFLLHRVDHQILFPSCLL
nr:MAG TPA: hypothetical protein [Caudoviricetes sp.]DAX38661.1 MAG TPA: hypothetical protein [Caudoviricetes sp.]